MNNAELYNQFNLLQIRDAEEIIEKFNKIYDAKRNRSETCALVDIGSGCGKVLAEVIFKKTNTNFRSLIGFDISNEMIEFAKKNYENEIVKFYCADVIGNGEENAMRHEMADIVTTFYCLHWIRDLR